MHETTGYTFSHMLLSYDLRLPFNLQLAQPADVPTSLNENVRNLTESFEDVKNFSQYRIHMERRS